MDSTQQTDDTPQRYTQSTLWDRFGADRVDAVRARLGRGWTRLTERAPEWLEASDLDEAELTRRAKERLVERSRRQRDEHIERERERREEYGHGYRIDPPPPLDSNPTPTSGEIASERRRARMSRWATLIGGVFLVPTVLLQVPLLVLLLPVLIVGYLLVTGGAEKESAAAGSKEAAPSPFVDRPAVARLAEPDEGTGTALDLLKTGTASRDDGSDAARTTATLDRVLSEHGVDARVTGHTRGPAVTRYLLTLGSGVRGSKISALAEDIGRAMECEHPPWVGPIAGDDRLAVELPNKVRDTVLVGDVLRALDLSDAGPLVVALGQDIDGTPMSADLTKLPHLLVGGATGAGKSVFLNALICSPLVRGVRPDELRMILIDPKRVELAAYKGIPHLLRPIITEASDAVDALGWVALEGGEMDRRYDLLAANKVKNIASFNELARAGRAVGLDGKPTGPLPYMLVVLDELADLIIVSKDDVETHVVRITQLARACGIHLVVATQRPSVDVVTGLIKANMPSRLAFATSSNADSRVVLDQTGAECLLGAGDALFKPMGARAARRLQAAMITDEEISAIVHTCSRGTGPAAPPPAVPALPDLSKLGEETLAVRAVRLAVEEGAASTSMLATGLKIRRQAAANLMTDLERVGVVGPSAGSKPRAVLITRADLPGVIDRLDKETVQ